MDPDRCLGLYCGKMNNESGLFFSCHYVNSFTNNKNIIKYKLEAFIKWFRKKSDYLPSPLL